MQTPSLPPYSLSDALSFLEHLRHYILFGDTDTPSILAGMERLQVYLLAEETTKQRMMEQYYQTVSDYESQLEKLRQWTDN